MKLWYTYFMLYLNYLLVYPSYILTYILTLLLLISFCTRQDPHLWQTQFYPKLLQYPLSHHLATILIFLFRFKAISESYKDPRTHPHPHSLIEESYAHLISVDFFFLEQITMISMQKIKGAACLKICLKA